MMRPGVWPTVTRPGRAAVLALAVAWSGRFSGVVVGWLPCGMRSNRRVPELLFKAVDLPYQDGWVVCSAAAARRECRHSATTVKHHTRRRSKST